jgi:lipopolysaccharide export system protein LptA
MFAPRMNLLPNKSVLLLSLLLVGHAATAHAEKSDHDKPIQIASDHLNVDDANRISTFEGKVELTQGTIRVIAEKLVVTEDAAGNKLCVATGNLASFRQKRDGANEYVEGYGERIEYDTRTETVNFYVRARVKREQDDVRGEHITYSTQTEIFNVDGNLSSGRRVRATIQPKNKEAAQAPLKNGEPNNNPPPKNPGN